jgi:hypothetical protein
MESNYTIPVQKAIRKETASAFAALTLSAITLFRAGTWPAAASFSSSKVLDCWGALYLNNSHLALSTLGIGLALGRRGVVSYRPSRFHLGRDADPLDALRSNDGASALSITDRQE